MTTLWNRRGAMDNGGSVTDFRIHETDGILDGGSGYWRDSRIDGRGPTHAGQARSNLVHSGFCKSRSPETQPQARRVRICLVRPPDARFRRHDGYCHDGYL